MIVLLFPIKKWNFFLRFKYYFWNRWDSFYLAGEKRMKWKFILMVTLLGFVLEVVKHNQLKRKI